MVTVFLCKSFPNRSSLFLIYYQNGKGVATGGKHDNSVRIWEPKWDDDEASEVQFVPRRKATVDGQVLSITMSRDGALLAAGCSLKNSPNGYVVVWNLNDNGKVLGNLRSRTLLRFGRVHAVEFMKFDHSSSSSRKTTSSSRSGIALDFDSIGALPESSPALRNRGKSQTQSTKFEFPRGRRRGHKSTKSLETPLAMVSRSKSPGTGKSAKSPRSSKSPAVRTSKSPRMKTAKSPRSTTSPRRKMVTLSRKQSDRNKSTNYKPKTNGFKYLLFGADTTGTIMCWNLSLSNYQTPIYVINGHSDIIYDLKVLGNRLFSVSHDHHVRCLEVGHFPQKIPDLSGNSVDHATSTGLFKDDSKYPLKAICVNPKTNELIFGSRTANIFKLSDLESKQSDEWSFGRGVGSKAISNGVVQGPRSSIRSRSSSIKTSDLDHIQKLKLRSNLLMVQRAGINYVKVFDVKTNKMIKKYQVEDGQYADDVECHDTEPNKYRIYDSGISFDQKYAILCVGVLTKENCSNLEANRSSLKGFRIPKCAAK